LRQPSAEDQATWKKKYYEWRYGANVGAVVGKAAPVLSAVLGDRFSSLPSLPSLSLSSSSSSSSLSDDGGGDEEEEELQHKMDTQQMVQRLSDALHVHKKWTEQHRGTEATSGSMLRHVQDRSSSSSSSSSSSDSKGPDESFAIWKTILRLVAAGRSVGETRREYLLRRMLVHKPKDLNRDWSPRFSTLRDKNG
jgi:hypothetical protein